MVSMKWIIWKERNVAKYQKQIATKSKRIHILKAEISFYFHTQHIKLGTISLVFSNDDLGFADTINSAFSNI